MPGPAADGAEGHRRAVARILDILPTLMRRWERDARTLRWPEELSGGVADVQTLHNLAREPGMAAGELARNLSMSESAVTSVLNRLEDAGLITRERATRDRRVVRLRITETGTTVLARAHHTRLERASRQLSRLSEGELDQLAVLLQKMADAPDLPGR